MATLVFLAGYLVYIVCMMALWFLVLVDVFPSLIDKPSSIIIPIAFIFPLALKNFPWVVLVSETSVASQVAVILVCLTCHLVCTLIGVVVLNVGFFRPASRKHLEEESPGYRHVMVGCITFGVMDMFLSYSSMVVNGRQRVPVLVEKPSFTYQLLSSLPFSIKPTLLDPAGYLAGMLATLVALVALSFLMAKVLSLLARLLPLDTYPRLRFATIVGLTFMVMRYMVDKPALISGMKAKLLGLSDFINGYRVAYLVVRYVTFLALALLPQVTACDKYYKAAIIISVGVVLTMRTGPSTPIQKPALTCDSMSAAAASTGDLDDFIRFSEQMMVDHKMAIDKIVSEFNLLIEESVGEIQSILVHAVLILLTPICATLFYVWNEYPVWIDTLAQRSLDKVPGWMRWAISREKR